MTKWPEASDWFRPNELCFCGSERPYEDCHRVKRYRHANEVSVDHLKFNKWWPECAVVENGQRCGQSIISSHSLQRKGTLGSVAEDHHVYTLASNKHGLSKSLTNKSELVRVGTREASTFRGLCAKHDNKIFSDIEVFPLPFNFRTFLGLAFRAALYEALEHTKATMWLGWLSTVPKFDFPFYPEQMEHEVENMRHFSGYNWAQVKRIEKIRGRKSPRKLYFVAIEFEGKADITCTGNFCIELDFDGKVVQDFSISQLFSYAQISIIQHAPNKWSLILSGTNDQNPAATLQLLTSLLKQPRQTLADCALRAALVHVENTYFRPSWIDSLSHHQRTELVERSDYGTDFHVGEKKAVNTLCHPLEVELSHRVLRISHNLHSALKKRS